MNSSKVVYWFVMYTLLTVVVISLIPAAILFMLVYFIGKPFDKFCEMDSWDIRVLGLDDEVDE